MKLRYQEHDAINEWDYKRKIFGLSSEGFTLILDFALIIQVTTV